MDHLGHCCLAKARFQANGDGFYPVPEDVDPLEAAFVVVGSMGVQGARKTRLQMGEAAMVTGLGILGLFAVQSMVRMGATPLIAVDFAEDRRRVALELGADYALAPDAHFVEAVRELTEGRMIQANVEVTGSSAALLQSLQVAARGGRIALAGVRAFRMCPSTFIPWCTSPACNSSARTTMCGPAADSYWGYWTRHDDFAAMLAHDAHGQNARSAHDFRRVRARASARGLSGTGRKCLRASGPGV